MKFTYQELTDLREILTDEINHWSDAMFEFEEKYPGTKKTWEECSDSGVDMPDQNSEIYDQMNHCKFRANELLRIIDRHTFE